MYARSSPSRIGTVQEVVQGHAYSHVRHAEDA
jgi:hypothetical protein